MDFAFVMCRQCDDTTPYTGDCCVKVNALSTVHSDCVDARRYFQLSDAIIEYCAAETAELTRNTTRSGRRAAPTHAHNEALI